MANLYRKPPPEIADHPLFHGGATVGLLTADAPRFPSAQGGNHALKQDLDQLGLKYDKTQGSYGGPEESFVVYGGTREQLYGLGKKYGQEAVVHSQDGRHELLYTNGPHDGKFHPSLPTMGYSKHQPDDYYTTLPGRGHVTLHFDQSKLLDSPVKHTLPIAQQAPAAPAAPGERPVTKAEVAQRLAVVLRKSLSPQPWAGHYAWHEGHSSMHQKSIGHGVLLTNAQEAHLLPLAKADPVAPTAPPAPAEPNAHPTNEQAAGKGVSTYAKYAAPYGSLAPGAASNLKFYPMEGQAGAVNKLVADHGFQVHYAGGKHGKPDLANKNYDTGHLMIWDPSAGSGGDFGHADYTDNWRKTHELAHALTRPALNEIYGEGRRMGGLGKQRTTREALRAVHWEHMVAHKQRDLAAKMGIHISDEDFNREYNTVMHDAVHRAVTGKFTEPSEEGFNPHPHAVPLETSLGMVRDAAEQMGLQHPNDTLKKNLSLKLAGLLREALRRNGFPA